MIVTRTTAIHRRLRYLVTFAVDPMHDGDGYTSFLRRRYGHRRGTTIEACVPHVGGYRTHASIGTTIEHSVTSTWSPTAHELGARLAGRLLRLLLGRPPAPRPASVRTASTSSLPRPSEQPRIGILGTACGIDKSRSAGRRDQRVVNVRTTWLTRSTTITVNSRRARMAPTPRASISASTRSHRRPDRRPMITAVDDST